MPTEWDIDGAVETDGDIEWDIGGVVERDAEGPAAPTTTPPRNLLLTGVGM